MRRPLPNRPLSSRNGWHDKPDIIFLALLSSARYATIISTTGIFKDGLMSIRTKLTRAGGLIAACLMLLSALPGTVQATQKTTPRALKAPQVAQTSPDVAGTLGAI